MRKKFFWFGRSGYLFTFVLQFALSCIHVSNSVHANITFVNDASAFVLGGESSVFELGKLSKMSGWNDGLANWSNMSFQSGDNGIVDPTLWALFAQEGDVIGFDEAQNNIDPSRFYIPEDRQIHITEDTIIDGNGKTLELEAHAHIVVDNGVTLTLRNMRIKNTQNDLANPIIRPTGHLAQVALQDVELALADDFIFRDGHLFIHDDVLVSGTCVFSYRSTQTSYICDGATLGFAYDSTFFYYPSTSDNHLIQMLGKTSGMYFDGATLLTTHTGMRLSKGTLCLDNSVTLSSAAETLLSVVTTQTQRHYAVDVNSTDWSPDGKYLAIGGEYRADGHEILVYSFDGSTLSADPITSRDFVGNYVLSVAWSPDGKHLAIGGDGSGNDLYVYRFDGSVLSESFISRAYGGDIQSVSWSPDGNYLAVGGHSPTSGNDVQV